MSKGKILAFSAVVAAGAVAVVLRGKPTGAAATGAKSSSQAIPAVDAALPVRPVASVPPASTNQTPTARGTLPYVLTSARPFTKPLRQAAESLGAKTVGALSQNALLVEVDEAARVRLSGDGRFEEISEYLPSSKVQSQLAARIADGAQSVDVAIISLSGEYRPFVLSCLKAGGGALLEGCINEGDTIRATLPAALVAELSMRGDIRWLEAFERPRLMNDIAVNPPAMNVRAVWDLHGLTGEGQNISTSDSGIDTGDMATLHRDLRNRVKDIKVVSGCVRKDVIGHGTHTAGSIVGDGTESGGLIRGTAYGAGLYAWFCSDGDNSIFTPKTMDELYTNQGAWDAHIHSASWGVSSAGQYNAECAEHDKYAWEHPEFLPVFSAGNEGSGVCTVGSPAASKNVLAVGATQNLRVAHDGGAGNGDPTVTASYSSRGPCLDGRIKPDVASPGTGVLSTRAHGVDYSYGNYNEFYAYDTGTSMACPLTAGAVALVRQWLVEQKGFADEDGKRPTAALMKAVIMGGAKDAAVPNNDQGWGRVDLEQTLFPSDGRAVKLIDRIPFAQDFVTNIVIETTNAAPLDVQLVWVDYPGSAEGSQAVSKLVNDLDLTVEARIAGQPTRRYGNGNTGPDTLNNAESVRIVGAEPTKYVITVKCKTVLHDYTEGGAAALYIRGAFDPDAVVEPPVYVHLRKLDKGFLSLDSALEAVQDGDETVELLDWVGLDRPVTLTTNVTIAAMTDDAARAYVARLPGAMLTVSTNATLTLSNVVFAASTDMLADVQGEGCLKLGPKVDMGVDIDHVSVRTADARGFDLAGALTRKFLIQCAAATNLTQTFGAYSCADAVAAADAEKIVCADDVDRETRGAVGPGRTLVWKFAEVPLDEAAGYHVDNTGTNTSYRMDRALARFSQAYKDGTASTFIALKNGAMNIPFAVANSLTFRGEGAVPPVLTTGSAAGFKVPEGGLLTVSNLVFSGYVDANANDDSGFIYVNGGAVTLDDGAMLEGMTGRVWRGSGIIDLFGGTVTMKPGSSIANCTAEGGNDAYGTSSGGFGGAIYVVGAGCTLNMQGCTIANCHASAFGGAVFVDVFGDPAVVNLSDDIMLAENDSDNAPSDNICFFTSDGLEGFRLVDDVQGYAGVWCETHEEDAPTGNDEGDAFMVNAAGASVSDVASFFCDADETGLLRGALGEADKIVWKKTSDDGQCLPYQAVALQIDRDGNTNYYASVARAFEYMGGNSPYVVELVANDALETAVAVPAGCAVTLTASKGCALDRWGSAGISVPAGASLTLSEILVRRTQSESEAGLVTNAFIAVNGGDLTLADGACVSNLFGNASRDANAITVCEDGTLTMLPGARILGCRNVYNFDKVEPTTEAKDYGVGGGILVDGATAHLRGGTVSGCAATRGGGVYVCNKSKVCVAGSANVVGNVWLCSDGENGGASNLLVEDLSELYVDGNVSGEIGTGDYINWVRDTNLVAKVSEDWGWTPAELAGSAARFSHDSLTNLTGVAATNASEAVILWSSAVVNGVYTNADGVVYRALGMVPRPKYMVVTNTPGPISFLNVVRGETTCTLTMGDLVRNAKYLLYKTNSLTGGFDVEGAAPFTNFTAEADGPCDVVLPLEPAPVFWRALGVETYTTNYFEK